LPCLVSDVLGLPNVRWNLCKNHAPDLDRTASEARGSLALIPSTCVALARMRIGSPRPPPKRSVAFPNTHGFYSCFFSKVLLWLLRAETAFFPCFFLPPPPLSGQTPAPAGSTTAPISVGYPLGAESFVLWGMTFGVVSQLAVAGGGAAFAHQGPPPYFRQVCPKLFRRAAFFYLVGSL